MNIKGEYRDILSKNGELIMDTGWRSNVIVEDYGRFLASLMKKDFNEKVGIEYIAVGGGSEDYAKFKTKVASFFDSKEPDELPIPTPDKGWIWAKKIDADKIKYLDPEDKEVTKVTNKLEIEVTVKPNEPSEKTFEFKEFALLGVDIKKSDGTFATDKMFFINYVNHGVITKDKSMELTRTIKLTFPLGE